MRVDNFRGKTKCTKKKNCHDELLTMAMETAMAVTMTQKNIHSIWRWYIDRRKRQQPIQSHERNKCWQSKMPQNSALNCFDNFYGVKHIDRPFAYVCMCVLPGPRWCARIHTMQHSALLLNIDAFSQLSQWKRSLFFFRFLSLFVVVIVVFLRFIRFARVHTRNIQYMLTVDWHTNTNCINH